MFLELSRNLRAIFRDFRLGAKRSPKWPAVEREVLEKTKACEACKGTKKLQVHHKLPFHLHPELELDPKNLVVLCMGRNACHLLIGHGDNFQMYTPHLDALLEKVNQGKLSLEEAQQVALQNRISE